MFPGSIEHLPEPLLELQLDAVKEAIFDMIFFSLDEPSFSLCHLVISNLDPPVAASTGKTNWVVCMCAPVWLLKAITASGRAQTAARMGRFSGHVNAN